ncbi:MAG TPA: 50S ribosomal protein L35 [Candidatus Hydrogenedentes bacterium]|nr:50S ribosomal protein L35 [Candidatus Hydrogenedentota bacterium]HOL77697.1 50S ribosomal protein L35 [Candidatus Hydrogenedentota bacterium]HPO86820.1 50S ribosomal protein L35 [Candidatus Hydrogenedentota bacterium]
MPKIKSNRAAMKRFRRTKTGKFKRDKAYASHLMTHKSAKRRRRLRTPVVVSPSETARVKRLLPYA